jgi:RecG-like helicase
VDEETVRFGVLVALFASIAVTAAFLGDARTRYDSYTVDAALEQRPTGQEVIVEGNVTDVIGVSERSGIRYLRFALGGEDGRVMVYCSLFNQYENVSVGDEVVVEGTFTSYQQVLEVSTQCFRVRDKG